MPGELPQLYMFPRSHGNTQGEVPVVLVRSPEVWEHPQPLGEHTCMGTSSTTFSLWKLQLSEVL
jgi:hypothetical protein